MIKTARKKKKDKQKFSESKGGFVIGLKTFACLNGVVFGSALRQGDKMR